MEHEWKKIDIHHGTYISIWYKCTICDILVDDKYYYLQSNMNIRYEGEIPTCANIICDEVHDS